MVSLETMNAQASDLLNSYCHDAFAGAMTFPETLRHMSSLGVRWYSANLQLGVKTHYLDNGEIHPVKWPGWTPPGRFVPFREDGVTAALRAIQGREIIYPEFLRRISEAGVVVYTVHLQGGLSIYLGPDGDFYVEKFPRPA